MSGQITPNPPNPPRPTMREVAALAGVALKTVSRVFNDVPSVDPVLAQRTRVAAARLGYRPNVTASNLRRRSGRTATIGLLLDDVANPFFAAVHRAVQDAAGERDSLVLTGSLDGDADRERELAHTLLGRQVDGLIIAPAGADHSYLLPDQLAGTRLVFLDRPPVLLRAEAVVSDNRVAARTAVTHLVTAGHRRIAFVGDRTALYTARERLAGYCAALDAAGILLEPSLIGPEARTAADAADAVLLLLELPDPPTALFTAQNLVTIGATRALRSCGRQHGIALVGFDDFVLADALDPPLTVIAQDSSAMGRLAAELLFAQIDGTPGSGELHLVPAQLIPRGSGEIPGPYA